MTAFKPRQQQAQVLEYARTGGRMGVAAVPGAGKTRTLSELAAALIQADRLTDGQEVLIVTLVNAAVDNFEQAIRTALRREGLFTVGYRVRTLHGLCSDIVRERPALVGLGETFTILDERESDRALQQATAAWLDTHPQGLNAFLDPELPPPRLASLRSRGDLNDLIVGLARDFIRTAKDHRIEPDAIATGLVCCMERGDQLSLAELCHGIYADYQRALQLAGAIDFQDLIRLALDAFDRDPAYLLRLRQRWPYLLEDEAQDSSALQQQLLERLSGPGGSWVRVGDPNQAIYESFTAARPEFLRDFLGQPDVTRRELPTSGRCAPKILALANYLIDWTREHHPAPAIRQRQPLQPPYIQPTPPGDPQPNPADSTASITLWAERLTPDEELELVTRSAAQWLSDHPGATVAALAATNHHAGRLVEKLRAAGVPFVEKLRSTTSTRRTAGALTYLLTYLAHPDHAPALARAYEVWRRADRADEDAHERTRRVIALLKTLERVEAFTQPGLGDDWLTTPDAAALIAADPVVGEHLLAFRAQLRRWSAAVVLPVDQLLLVLAQDTFTTAVDLAIAYSMAAALRGISVLHPNFRLADYAAELQAIAANERKFLSLDPDGRGFVPAEHAGKLIVMTLHAAKGLEFDRVYLLSCNAYDFPSGLPGDQYTPEKWFVRDRLNLSAETIAQLHTVLDPARPYVEGAATAAARIEFVGERLRLLYVGITRARRDLIVTWNAGRRGDIPAALPFLALRGWLENQRREGGR